MGQRYGFLRLMAVVYKVLAWVALIGGIIANTVLAVAVGALVDPQLGATVGVMSGLGTWIVTGVLTLLAFGTFYALSQAVYLIFDIENGARVANEKLSVRRAV